MESRKLPLSLRLWSRLGRFAGQARQQRVARALARRQLRPDALYRGPESLSLQVDPADYFQPLMVLGMFDPIVTGLIGQHARPGSVALDAGTHIGYITLHLARAVGPAGEVHSFEPDPRLMNRAVEHARANGMDWVKVNHVAVSDASESGISMRLPAQVGWASLREGIGDAEQTIEVDTVALDDYVEREGIDPARIGFVKLDVEGVEFEALRGLDRTLRAGSPKVLVEYIPDRMRGLGQDPEQLLSYMRERGYEPWVPQRRSGGGLDLIAGAEPQEGEDVLFQKTA